MKDADNSSCGRELKKWLRGLASDCTGSSVGWRRE
jgi:hypothetical protein